MGIEVGHERWSGFTSRIGIGAERLLALFAEHRVRATFFVVGAIAERHPEWVEKIADAGHEVGTHGHHHRKIYELGPKEFAADLTRSIRAIRAVTGRDPIGHRAPYFSITTASTWAFDVLADHGIRYDASVFPGKTWRYGIADAPDTPFVVEGRRDLVEFPVATGRFLRRTIGIGGAYFRIVPLAVTARALRQRLAVSRHASFYIHPWELDPWHPIVRFPAKAMATHYFGLFLTRGRLERLLRRFRFCAFEDWLAALRHDDLPRRTLA